MPSRVRQLLDRLTTQGVTVKSLETDSRAVQPGDVFLAWPGSRDDGRRHIGSAIAAGQDSALGRPRIEQQTVGAGLISRDC